MILIIGRGRKYFEYEKEMEEVLEKKKNVHPELLLASNTIMEQPREQQINEENGQIKQKNLNEGGENNQPDKIGAISSIQPSKSKIVKKKMSTMEKMRLDRKAYYEERLTIERKKIELMEKRNKLIEERNNILKEKQFNCQCDSS